MRIEQIYTGCLAQGAYYIVSNREAAIIDPLRETKTYLERLEKDGVELKYIFETHFHADFVSGHLDLSKATGEPIIYGPNANPEYDAIIAEEGQVFGLGWALSGACPGPMVVNIGYGYLTMAIVFLFATIGTFIYGLLKDKLPH
jgi:glyoxylase-like metal-dependent hydrolase (beta-lactamase superfamily II)